MSLPLRRFLKGSARRPQKRDSAQPLRNSGPFGDHLPILRTVFSNNFHLRLIVASPRTNLLYPPLPLG
jgi:hypothetical protein